MNIQRTLVGAQVLAMLAFWVPLTGGRGMHGLAGVAAPPHPAAAAQPAALPDSQAGRCVAAWLDLISDPAPQRVEAFESTYRSPKRLAEVQMEERIRRAREVGDRLGRLTLKEVMSIAPDAIDTLVTNERGEVIELEFL